jgi:gluconolactonase
MSEWETLFEKRDALFEGPRFHVDLGLVYADVRLGGVYRTAGRDTRVLVPHRRGIGGLVFHAAGGLVITGRNVAYKALSPDQAEVGETVVLLDAAAAGAAIGFNDLITDPAGRVYVGSLALQPSAIAIGARPSLTSAVWLIDGDGVGRLVADDIWLPNGMAMSPDGKVLLVADSGRNVVFAFPVDADSGDLGPRRALIDVDDGVVDGICTAEDGTLLVAQTLSRTIGRYDTDGSRIASMPVPTGMVTSVSFGGAGGRSLYAVSGVPEPGGTGTAAVVRRDYEVGGAAVPPARIPVNR